MNQSNKAARNLPIIKKILMNLIGSAILAFGLYHVHSFSGVTEGGVLGLTLLLHHWLDISPAVSGFLMNFICYFIGWRILGKSFVVYSFVAGGAFSVFYGIFEQFDPLWPQLAEHPFYAAIVGALFVGIGVGLCVRCGGAPGGDDALSMSISKVTGLPIQRIYLVSDLIVLGLSACYIPLPKLAYSLMTVLISGQLVGWVQRVSF